MSLSIPKGADLDLSRVTASEMRLRFGTGNGLMLRADQPADALGVPMPKARDVAFCANYVIYEDSLAVDAEYVTAGPTFKARCASGRMEQLMYSERKHIEHRLQHQALKDLQAAVEAHNAVVQPIYNGPEDRVYLSETGHRVSEAVKACATPGEQPDAIELQAACRANCYAADIVIANFNRRTL